MTTRFPVVGTVAVRGTLSDLQWQTTIRTTTRGTNDTRVINLRNGRYRVTAPTQHAHTGTTSNTITFKK